MWLSKYKANINTIACMFCSDNNNKKLFALKQLVRIWTCFRVETVDKCAYYCYWIILDTKRLVIYASTFSLDELVKNDICIVCYAITVKLAITNTFYKLSCIISILFVVFFCLNECGLNEMFLVCTLQITRYNYINVASW